MKRYEVLVKVDDDVIMDDMFTSDPAEASSTFVSKVTEYAAISCSKKITIFLREVDPDLNLIKKCVIENA